MFSKWIDFLSKGLQYLFLPLEFPAHFFRIIALTFFQRSLVRGLIHLKTYRQWFIARKFKTIIDVGANSGPFAFSARLLQPGAHIYAFEPLPTCYNRLIKNLSPMGNFNAFQSAIGDQEGEVEMWESGFSESSSILPMDELHKQIFPHTAELHPLRVSISRLDTFLNQIKFEPPVLLKIDVQGYEDKVLAGAVKTLMYVDWIITEMSFQPLYKDQALFSDIYQWLSNKGFKFAGNMDNLVSPSDGSILQTDGIFYRE